MPNKYRERATKNETDLAKALTKQTGRPWRRQPKSGAIKAMPGDVVSAEPHAAWWDAWLLELKNRDVRNARGEKSLRVEKKELEQMQREAASKDSLPALIYRMTGDRQLWVVVPIEVLERTWTELQQRTKRKRTA